MPLPPHPAALDAERLLDECEQTFMRRSGPGVRTETRWRRRSSSGTGPRVSRPRRASDAAKGQSGRGPVSVAIELALVIRRPIDFDGPTSRWVARRRAGRIAISPEHEDFPAILAETSTLPPLVTTQAPQPMCSGSVRRSL